MDGNSLHLDRCVGFMDMDIYQNSLKSSFKIYAFHCILILPQKYYIKVNSRNYFLCSCEIYESRKEESVLSVSFRRQFFFHQWNRHLKYA